jgi:uncharacterized protein YutD
MNKEKLQNITDYKVMNIKECLDALKWNYNYNETTDTYNDITCPCGGEMKFSGFFGTEVIECNKCKKSMTDLFSPIQNSNSTCTFLNSKNFEIEDNRHWVANDGNGGIKIEVSKHE